uniref:Src kinase-associated phosphoprotein 2 n=2 Tax=Ornithorhynchus anatinus TaxID=9258 RepID=A0A6I8MYG1_ORNAN
MPVTCTGGGGVRAGAGPSSPSEGGGRGRSPPSAAFAAGGAGEGRRAFGGLPRCAARSGGVRSPSPVPSVQGQRELGVEAAASTVAPLPAPPPPGAPPARTMHSPCSVTSPVPEDIRNLLADLEIFIGDTLRGENLSKKAKERKEYLIKKIKDVKLTYAQEFQERGEAEDGEDSDDLFPGPPDNLSVISDRYDKEDETPSDGNQFPPIAAQDLPFVLKASYLEKRRKDHSFLGFEWQKRWCALSRTVFYYYGSDKDKQQKGEFAIDGYTARMNNTLRKDGKKDCCFEICAPDKRIYQFTAATPKDAEEWVQQLKFVLQDMESDIIPEDDDERGELYDDVDHPPPISSPPKSDQPIDDEIYEELPEEEEDSASLKAEEQRKINQENVSHSSGDKNTDYANFYQGLWDCTGAVPDELSFKRGDVIYILSKA